MRVKLARLASRAVAAVAIGGTTVLAVATPGQAATTTASQAAAAKAKYIQASGYTGKKVHVTWAGPSVGVTAWTVGSDFVATKTNAYKSCKSNVTGVDVDVSWDSESLHNGAKLGMLISVKLSNGQSKGIVALTASKAVNWPGHPAFGGEYRATISTPGNVHVVQGRILSWISNGGVPYGAHTDTLTLRQFRRC